MHTRTIRLALVLWLAAVGCAAADDPAQVLVSHRLRTDLRWLGSEDREFSNRWRYRLMVEKEIAKGRTSIVPYVNVEPYYDSRYNTVNRVRVIPGASVSWSPR